MRRKWWISVAWKRWILLGILGIVVVARADDEGLSGAEVEGHKDPTSEELLQHAKELLRKENPEMSVVLDNLENASKLGSGEAASLLGQILTEGDYEIPIETERAMKFFLVAAERGDAIAQSFLAFFSSIGRSVEEQPAMAMLYHFFAAKGGSEFSQAALGYRYLYGVNAEKSCEAAASYYLNPAKQAYLRPEAIVNQVVRRYEDPRPRLENDDLVHYERHSAQKGDVGAMVFMGELNLLGVRGVRQDYQQALQFLRPAANHGNPTALVHLGHMHLEGLGVPKSTEIALGLFQKAADKDDAAALNALGGLYKRGLGVPKDLAKAAEYFARSAQLGDSNGRTNIAFCYLNGEGVKKDIKQAFQIFQLAARGNNPTAQYWLAYLTLHGIGTQKSCSDAVVLLKRLTEKSIVFPLLAKAEEFFRAGDYGRALLLSLRGAEMGCEVAQSNAAYLVDPKGPFASKIDARRLGLTVNVKRLNLMNESEVKDIVDAKEEDSERPGTSSMKMSLHAKKSKPDSTGIAEREALALAMYAHASQQGNGGATLRMGDFYYYGWGVSKDRELAAHCYYEASSRGRHAQATFNIGFLHEWGIGGVPQDFFLAKRYFQLAAEFDPKAMATVNMALIVLGLHTAWIWFILPFLDMALAVGVAVILLALIFILRRFRRTIAREHDHHE